MTKKRLIWIACALALALLWGVPGLTFAGGLGLIVFFLKVLYPYAATLDSVEPHMLFLASGTIIAVWIAYGPLLLSLFWPQVEVAPHWRVVLSLPFFLALVKADVLSKWDLGFQKEKEPEIESPPGHPNGIPIYYVDEQGNVQKRDLVPCPLAKQRLFVQYLRRVLNGVTTWSRTSAMADGFTRGEYEALDWWMQDKTYTRSKCGLTDEGKKWARAFLEYYYPDADKI